MPTVLNQILPVDTTKVEAAEADAEDIAAAAAEWGLLLQLTGNPDAGFGWGDGGHFYFYGRRAAMEAGDFSGVWVVFEGETEYVRRCFMEYGVKTDPSGRYACMYKRWHLIGLEVGISVASVGLRGEPTGCATGWRADAVATAKKDLKAGELLDGEGGYTVVGRLMPAVESLAQGCLPLGLAHGWKLLKPVAAGEPLRWSDVACDANATAVRLRREMEARFRAPRRDAA